QSRHFAQQRLAFEDRLDLHERLDAHTMVAWASALLGDLAQADRSTASALGLFQSGQVHWWGLHSAAWRAYTLTLLGRWDEALAVAEHARKIWDEGGLIPAAYCERLVPRSEEHTSELQSRFDLVCRLLLEKKKSNM